MSQSYVTPDNGQEIAYLVYNCTPICDETIEYWDYLTQSCIPNLCPEGTYRNNNQECVECNEGCIECSSNTCFECENGYELVASSLFSNVSSTTG